MIQNGNQDQRNGKVLSQPFHGYACTFRIRAACGSGGTAISRRKRNHEHFLPERSLINKEKIVVSQK